MSNGLNPDQDRRSVDFTEPNVLPAPPRTWQIVNALKTCMIPVIEKGNFILVQQLSVIIKGLDHPSYCVQFGS